MHIQMTDPEVSPGFWQPGNFRVFISHVTHHAPFAMRLQRALTNYHITSFVARKDIRPADDWFEQVSLALQTSDLLLALVHRGFRASAWTGQEAGFAFGRGIPVLPIKLGEEPQGFLGSVQALEGQRRPVAWLARDIFAMLCSHKDTRKLMVQLFLRSLEASQGLGEARDNLALISKIGLSDQQIANSLRNIVEKNSFVARAWGGPDRCR